MSRYLNGRRIALRVIAYQSAIAVILGVVGLVFSQRVAISLAIGAFICVAANLWLALIAFRPKLGDSPSRMLAAFYAGAIGKFFITAGLFALVFLMVEWFKTPTYVALLILGYAVTQISVWLMPKTK